MLPLCRRYLRHAAGGGGADGLLPRVHIGGPFFFGWDKLSRGQHLLVTMLVALGSNLSALWILIANGWMQNPSAPSSTP